MRTRVCLAFILGFGKNGAMADRRRSMVIPLCKISEWDTKRNRSYTTVNDGDYFQQISGLGR
jgi:hypothetical protein